MNLSPAQPWRAPSAPDSSRGPSSCGCAIGAGRAPPTGRGRRAPTIIVGGAGSASRTAWQACPDRQSPPPRGSALHSCLVCSTVNWLLRIILGQALLVPTGWVAVPAGRCCSVSTSHSSRAVSSCTASLSIDATAHSCCFFVPPACICSFFAQF